MARYFQESFQDLRGGDSPRGNLPLNHPLAGRFKIDFTHHSPRPKDQFIKYAMIQRVVPSSASRWVRS